MEIIIKESYEKLSKESANLVAKFVLRKPNLVLGLATGSTPIGTYEELVKKHKQAGLDFSKVVTFNLDEYLGLAPGHPQSYHYFMKTHLFDKVNINPGNVHIPYGIIVDVDELCKWYEDEIKKAGGIDLLIIGIGRDGHIGFNEPGSSLGSTTRLKALTQETVEDNARFFNNKVKDVPHFAITVGVGTIMAAKHILLLANGEQKADAVAAALEGPVSAYCPASAVQLHGNVTAIIDKACASKLKRVDYYNFIQENKPKVRELLRRQIRAKLGLSSDANEGVPSLYE
jgi:glucosamine-6-phosphate deaminase